MISYALLHTNDFFEFVIILVSPLFQHLTSNQSPDDKTGADSGILLQYKDLIREQDQRINEITQANIYLQQELALARQQAEEMASSVQALQDQNSLLRFEVVYKWRHILWTIFGNFL